MLCRLAATATRRRPVAKHIVISQRSVVLRYSKLIFDHYRYQVREISIVVSDATFEAISTCAYFLYEQISVASEMFCAYSLSIGLKILSSRGRLLSVESVCQDV